MKLYCNGSSSSGNSYALRATDGEMLFIEAGCRFSGMLKLLNYKVDYAHAGLIISHEHGDHSKYTDEYTKHGIKAYSGVNVAKKFKGVEEVKEGIRFDVGKFRIVPYSVWHDVPDFGYLVYHPEMGIMFFATDCYNIPFTVKGLINHYLIEANYEDSILRENVENGSVKSFLAKRLMTSHFSIDNTIAWLKQCQAQTADDITLIHLSSKNSNRKMFKERIENTFGVPTYIAKKGLVIDYNKA